MGCLGRYPIHLLSVLSRLGVDLGFGEITIGEACLRHSLDVNSFLLVCNVYTYDDYIPSDELLSAGSPADIVKYLHNSHVFYLISMHSLGAGETRKDIL